VPTLSFADASGQTTGVTLSGNGASWSGTVAVTEAGIVDGTATLSLLATDAANPPNAGTPPSTIQTVAERSFIKARGAGQNQSTILTSLVTAQVPGGALAAGEWLIVSSRLPAAAVPADPTPAAGVSERKPTHHVFALGISSGVGTLAAPVTLIVPYTAAEVAGLNEDHLTLCEWNGFDWVALGGGTVDRNAKTVTVQITDVKSYYQLFDTIGPTSGGTLPREYVQFAPNPVTTGRAELRFYLTSDATVSLKIADASGEVVLSDSISGKAKQETRKSIDLSGLARGVYTYQLSAGGSTVVKRLAIVK
jgi:hypothetical protein